MELYKFFDQDDTRVVITAAVYKKYRTFYPLPSKQRTTKYPSSLY